MSDEDRHGRWNKAEQRYEDGCREDRPHSEQAEDYGTDEPTEHWLPLVSGEDDWIGTKEER